MGQFTFWRNVGALALMGTMTYADDQMVRDRNGDPWVISIRPGARMAGLPLPGVTRSVPTPSEPLPPTFSVPPRTTEVLLPEPPAPAPGRRSTPTTSAPTVRPTVAVDAPDRVVPPAPIPARPVAPSPPPAPPAPAPPRADRVPTPALPAPANLTLPTPEIPGPALAPPAAHEGDAPVIIPGHSTACTPRVNGRTYEEVYRSIPYSYVEYLANPSYRHEATMEILFGQLRPTTIHKESTPQLVPDPLESASPYRPFLFAHPEQWIYRYSDYRYQWYLTPQITAPFGVI